MKPSIQVVLRNKNGLTAESTAWALYNAMHRRTEFTIGTQRIVGCFADQSAPLYLGQDENKRAMFSVNFTLTLLANQ